MVVAPHQPVEGVDYNGCEQAGGDVERKHFVVPRVNPGPGPPTRGPSDNRLISLPHVRVERALNLSNSH